LSPRRRRRRKRPISRALVTGAAGFIGSHLCEHLLAEGDVVVGVDCFTPYYDIARKRGNIASLTGRDGFTLREEDLSTADLDDLLHGIEVVYHLAAQPGVRASWGADFEIYVRHNILAMQRLLEACRDRPLRFVYASSSSIYGDAEALPTRETAVPAPISPYGMTKLAGEHLCRAYGSGGKLQTAALRLFTVYGPRQRPDMAFARLVDAAVRGDEFVIYGDGEQTRDFTFVGDVVRAFRLCALSGWVGAANIGGGSRTSLNRAIEIVGSLAGEVTVRREGAQRGDVQHTAADVSLAREAFGWSPEIDLPQGLDLMVVEALRHAAPADG
jgi:nucleoside-diphosphate-sugar epimerase